MLVEPFDLSMYMYTCTHEYLHVNRENLHGDITTWENTAKQNANIPIKKMASDADFPNCCSKYLGMKDIMPLKALNCNTVMHKNNI